MPTTSNFGWSTPADTDLVKDGALAIRTLGNGIDTSMAELKGGTTGQILSKTSNTDMDFTWVTTDDANAIQNAIVDAKGDLIAATANDTPARLAVGSNGDTLVADSSSSTGLSWTGSIAAGRNAVINGGFDYWQRGTSFNPSSAAYVYTADRWEVYTYAASTCTVSQQTFTAGAAPVAGVEGRYFLNIINTNTGIYLRNKIEDVRTYAGQTVTLSFYAKASSNLTLTSNLEQNFGTGGSAAVANTATHSITTSWQRFTRTVTLASISGKTISTTDSSLQVLFTGTNNITLSIWGVQLEYGSVATPFSRAGGTLQGELAACQRYYQKTYAIATAPGAAPDSYPFNAINASTTLVVGVPVFKVTMRTAATVTLYSPVTGTSGKIRSGGADITASAADVGENGIGYISATGLTAGSNSAVSYVASAEL